MRCYSTRWIVWFVGVFLVFSSVVGAKTKTPSVAKTGSSSVEVKPAETRVAKINLDFVNADVEQVVRAIAPAVGKPHVFVDPRIKGTLSLSLANPLPPIEAWNVLVLHLKSLGFAVLESDQWVRVVLEADGRAQPSLVLSSQDNLPLANQLVTRFYPLGFDSVVNAQSLVRQYVSQTALVNVIPQTNTLVVTDYVDNHRRIEKLLGQMDVAPTMLLEIFPLQHAAAVDVASMIVRLLDDGRLEQNAKGLVLADNRTNSLIIRTYSAERLKVIRSLLDRLDQPNSRNGGMYWVPLKNSDAAKMAQILRNLMTADQSAMLANANSGGGIPASGQASGQNSATATPANAVDQAGLNQGRSTRTSNDSGGASGNGSQGTTAANLVNLPGGAAIQPDTATNSLIILASEPVYRTLRGIIEQLDVRRPQVFVETLVIELSADKTSEIGFQWQGATANKAETLGVYGGTSFGTGGNNILGLQATLAGQGTSLPSSGLNIAVGKKLYGAIGLVGLAKFLEDNAGGNVLATPNLLTLDNVEAKIIVGQNVPILTSQQVPSGTPANGLTNPLQSFERRDVGLTLRITPQILDANSVRLQVYQEMSSVLPKEVTGGIVTSKRVLETTVQADDGQMIVLGGLIQDNFTTDQSKVPLLGDIPLVGRLFQYEKTTRSKTNLVIFLRPYILRDSQAGQDIVMNRYDLLGRSRLQLEEGSRKILDDATVRGMDQFKNNPVRPPNPTDSRSPSPILPLAPTSSTNVSGDSVASGAIPVLPTTDLTGSKRDSGGVLGRD